MVQIFVGSESRSLEDFTEGWLVEQLKRHQRSGSNPCVKVEIHAGEIQMSLPTIECVSSGGGRPPNPREREILDLWNKHHLSESDWNHGRLTSFIKQVRNMI